MKLLSNSLPRTIELRKRLVAPFVKFSLLLREGFGRPNMPYWLSVIAFIESWISVVSIDALVIGTSLARKKNGALIAVLAAFGGSLGATLLVAAIFYVGQMGHAVLVANPNGGINEVSPLALPLASQFVSRLAEFFDGPSFAYITETVSGMFDFQSMQTNALQFYQSWGIFAVGFWAISFIPFQPFSFIYGTLMCLDLRQSNGTLLGHLIPFFALAFAGRSLKYFVLTVLCIQFPEMAKNLVKKSKFGKYLSE